MENPLWRPTKGIVERRIAIYKTYISTHVIAVLVSLGPHFLECEDTSDRVNIEQICVGRLLNDPVGNDVLQHTGVYIL